jgi:hypothetical protein
VITVDQVPRVTVADFTKAGLFDGKDCEGHIGTGDYQLSFTYRAAGCGVIFIGGRRYPFALVPSNLGRGSLRYFVCALTGRLTRTLYRPHANLPFGHRCAFRPVIGYASQLAGRCYHLQRAFQLSAQAERLRDEIRRWQHKGEPTRRVRRLDALEERSNAYWHHGVMCSPLFRGLAEQLSRGDREAIL